MAKILLISCNITQQPYPVYPLGLTMVAEAARKKGHTVVEWDPLLEDDIIKVLRENRFDIIGLSIRNVDNVNFTQSESYTPYYTQLVKQLREHSSSTIVLGGAGYSIFPKELLEETGADYGVVGEGEKAFCELIEQIEKGNPPTEKIIRSNCLLEGSEISANSRNILLADYYLKNGGMLNIQTKRGCPHQCAYCSYPTLEGNCYRFRPTEDVLDEIQILVEKYHADYFSITDSVFNDSKGNYLQIAKGLISRNISVPWMAFFRPQNFKKEEIELLKRSGLSSVEWGTDCSTDETLQEMNKDFCWEEVAHCNELFSSAGISNSHFIIFGGPGETQKTVCEGLDNIAKLQNCVVFASIGVRIFPNTPIHSRLIKEGIVQEGENLLQPKFYFSDSIKSENLHNEIVASFGLQIDRVYPYGQDIEKIKAFHRLGYRGPIWDMLLRKKETRIK